MTNKQQTYSKQVIEIADYLFKFPDKKMSEVLSYFAVKCRKNDRTIERYVQKAKEYNKSRLDRAESIKADAEDEETKKAAKKAILSRFKSLEILSNIANGTGRKAGDEILIPSDGDRIRAIQQLAKMEGWEAPTKTAQTDSRGNDIKHISPEDAAKFLKEVTKDYSKE